MKIELTQLKDGFATSLTPSKRNRIESEKTKSQNPPSKCPPGVRGASGTPG